MSKHPNTNPELPEDDGSDILVTLSLDDGSEAECRILTIFELEGQNYIVLLPLDEEGNDKEEGEVFLYRYFDNKMKRGTPPWIILKMKKNWKPPLTALTNC